MPNAQDQSVLDVLLESWDRNNTILINLLNALPRHGLDIRAMESSPSVAELFTHIHFVRLILIQEDAPAFTHALPEKEWVSEQDPRRIEQMLNESAAAVREVVKSNVETATQMQSHYDHPALFLQHMLWHEGYHHGQIKLALKLANCPISDELAGPLTWDVWMRKH